MSGARRGPGLSQRFRLKVKDFSGAGFVGSDFDYTTMLQIGRPKRRSLTAVLDCGGRSPQSQAALVGWAVTGVPATTSNTPDPNSL